MTDSKHVYSFGGGTAEGRGDQKQLLGGKGAGLAEMSGLGIPVPPGFTVTTEVCKYYHAHDGAYPVGMEEQFEAALARVEELQGKRFGDPVAPLLLSVRSGGPFSMPGMMDTVLNLGLNDEIVEGMIAGGFDERFVRDCYRRLLTMFGDVVMGVPFSGFERRLAAARERAGVKVDSDLDAGALADLAASFKEYIAASGTPFPQDPREQLRRAVHAVFESWNNQRAIDYRRIHGMSEDSGTGVNVQTMVFGNGGPDCATGVAFTRDPATGEKRIYGEYLVNAQGEDVVAGIRTPLPIEPTDGTAGLAGDFPEAYEDLKRVCRTLENHRREMQDVEFTIERKKLYMLQTRDGQRTGLAAVRLAVEMAEEGLIDRVEALRRVEGSQIVQLLAPGFDVQEKQKSVDDGLLMATGLAAGPGAASGRVALTADRAAEMAKEGPVLLVRDETSPEDIVGMHASAGILTSRGGMTSHAAIVARGLGKPCVVGAGELVVDEEGGEVRANGHVVREGEPLSIDGTTGEVIACRLTPRESEVLRVVVDGQESDAPAVRVFRKLVEWADAERRMKVRTNADTPHDARVARALGAQGIGLCRTEHMFFEEDRITWMRQAILASDVASRGRALRELLPMQQADFEGIFEAMDGLPVTVRLLDPPLHEFLPKEEKALERLAAQMELEPRQVLEEAEKLAEFNPMLGLRGCRLGLTVPEIYDMQVEAIARAACSLAGRGLDPKPEIMVPLIGGAEEMLRLRRRSARVADRVREEEGVQIEIPIGTMIEVPRAALVADKVAEHADFFSFGTNDLTQMTYGYSRDDAGRFLPFYLEEGILPFDPFERLDVEGVGQLVEIATQRGRASRPGIKIGICGEHGGQPHSIAFFERCGLDY
ncbi:MAG: pyruvate, phosphate dikinase, partial [Thermoanaerobaculia bacterium]|nr:pyruvate, phosphate dikinase [Thermoanaerobaculia bacterium]